MATLEQRVHERTEQLQEARDEAQAANRAKSAFLANMSHELRTPLTGIIGFSELVMDELSDRGMGDLNDDIAQVCHAAHHLLALVNDILDLAKVEAGKVTVDLQPVAIAQALEEARAIVLPMAAAHHTQLHVLTHGRVQAMADPLRLKQCLVNLTSNAARFTRGGSITLAAEAVGPTVTIRIRDTGIGMNAEQSSRLFRAFEQVHEGHSRGGTGLGLVLTQRLLSLMNGSVDLESSVPGQGSTFRIRLAAA